jgi:putative hemin transport protein
MIAEIFSLYQKYKQTTKLREKRIADKIGVSEGMLLVARMRHDVLYLNNQYLQDILKHTVSLGRLLCVLRNNACISEAIDSFNFTLQDGNLCNLHTQRFSLHLNTHPDLHVFAIHNYEEKKFSLQICDPYGYLITKLHLQQQKTVSDFVQFTQGLQTKLPNNIFTHSECQAFDYNHYIQNYSYINSLGDIAELVTKNKINLAHTPCSAREESSYQDMVTIIKRTASIDNLLLAAVANSTAVQVHIGSINNLSSTNDCFNIVDDNFHLHMYNQVAVVYKIVLNLKACKITVLQSFDVHKQPILLLASLE